MEKGGSQDWPVRAATGRRCKGPPLGPLGGQGTRRVWKIGGMGRAEAVFSWLCGGKVSTAPCGARDVETGKSYVAARIVSGVYRQRIMRRDRYSCGEL